MTGTARYSATTARLVQRTGEPSAPMKMSPSEIGNTGATNEVFEASPGCTNGTITLTNSDDTKSLSCSFVIATSVDVGVQSIFSGLMSVDGRAMPRY